MKKLSPWSLGVAGTWMISTLVAAQQPELRSTPKVTAIQTRIEQPIDMSTGQPLVTVLLNGKGPYRLAIDTGSPFTILDDDLFKQIRPRGFREVREPSGQAILVVGIDSLSINGAVFDSFEAIMVDYDEIHGGKRTKDGTIGFNLFANALVTLDFPQAKAVFEKGALSASEGIVPYRINGGVPAIPVRFGESEIETIVGTGTVGGFALGLQHRDTVRVARRTFKSRGSTSLDNVVPSVARDEVGMGTFLLTRPSVYFYGQESTVGMGVLSRFSVTFDQKRKILQLARPTPGPVDYSLSQVYGFSVQLQRGRYVVTYVRENSAASAVGMKPGDVLRFVNNEKVTRYREPQLRDIINQADMLVMKLNREGFDYLCHMDKTRLPDQ